MVRRIRVSGALLAVMIIAGVILASYPSQQLNAQDESWPPFFGMRPVEFSSFEEALAELSDGDIARLDALVLERSIPELTASMESGDLTSYELTLYSLHRIRTYDVDQLNSIVDLNPDALEIAKERDEERAAGEVRGMLHGVPVLLKDNISTSSYLYTSAGAAALATALADRDAFLVRRLRDAGGIMLGKSNMTEWANWMHYAIANGYSAVGGQIVSPYSEWVDPSGSSSGSAVAVTSNFAPLAMGTETIGSIISPAGRSSVVGYKPSLGLVSRDMLIPITDEIDTAGPIGKTVADVAIAMTVLAAESDQNDPLSANAQALVGADFTAWLKPDELKGARVGLLAVEPAESDAYQLDFYALWEEMDAFEAAGAEVVIIRPPGFPETDWETLFSWDIREEVDHYLAQSTQSDVHSLAEVTTFNEQHPEFIPYGQERLYEAAACSLSAEEIVALGASTRETSAEYMADLFAEYDVDLVVGIDDVFSLQYALAGYPAISLPRGVSVDGVPSGLTLVGPYLSDMKLLGYAYAFEQTDRWRIPPPIVTTSEAEE